MTPDNEFKKFLILILVISGIYFGINSEIGSKIIKEGQSHIFSALFSEKDITADSDTETDKENWVTKTFIKKNPTQYWISGNIKINGLSNYNSVSKNQIYNFRKYYVNKTIFNDRNYTPTEEIFGGIKENHKWVGIEAYSCIGANTLAYKSMSKESKFINNPSILVGIDYASYPKNYMHCNEQYYLLPNHMNFSKDDNTFYLTYIIPDQQRERLFKLVGLNARDLGFKYGYCRKSNNISFVNQLDNISKNIYEFKDAIRIDSSCGVSGGCNNNISYQEELFFNIDSSPATFELKLWKEKPESISNKSDINFTIILE